MAVGVPAPCREMPAAGWSRGSTSGDLSASTSNSTQSGAGEGWWGRLVGVETTYRAVKEGEIKRKAFVYFKAV